LGIVAFNASALDAEEWGILIRLCGLGFTLGMGVASAFETEVREAVPGLETRETWGTQSQSLHPQVFMCFGFYI
jgi:hypothetical protein